MDKFSRQYVKLALKALRWMLLLCLVAGLGAGVSTMVAVPQLQKATSGKGVLVEQTPDGQERVVYGKEKTPDSFDEEMDFPAEQLIYQKQERFDQPDDIQPDEGGVMDRAAAPRADRRRIERTVRAFLPRWETFTPGFVDSDRYRDRLRPYTDISALGDLAGRKDSREHYAVGRATGSRLTAAVARRDVSDSMSVLRYSPENAYVSVAARVTYTGPALSWAGRTMLRSYGVVLVNDDGTWKIARVAAENLSDLSG
jgi:hypothetical protein